MKISITDEPQERGNAQKAAYASTIFWHKRVTHPHTKAQDVLKSTNIGVGRATFARQKKYGVAKEQEHRGARATTRLERFFTSINDLLEPPLPKGERFTSRTKTIYLLRRKSKAVAALQQVKLEVADTSKLSAGVLRSDQGGGVHRSRGQGLLTSPIRRGGKPIATSDE